MRACDFCNAPCESTFCSPECRADWDDGMRASPTVAHFLEDLTATNDELDVMEALEYATDRRNSDYDSDDWPNDTDDFGDRSDF